MMLWICIYQITHVTYECPTRTTVQEIKAGSSQMIELDGQWDYEVQVCL